MNEHPGGKCRNARMLECSNDRMRPGSARQSYTPPVGRALRARRNARHKDFHFQSPTAQPEPEPRWGQTPELAPPWGQSPRVHRLYALCVLRVRQMSHAENAESAEVECKTKNRKWGNAHWTFFIHPFEPSPIPTFEHSTFLQFIIQNAVQCSAFYATISWSFGEVGDYSSNDRSLTYSVMAHCMADALTREGRASARPRTKERGKSPGGQPNRRQVNVVHVSSFTRKPLIF